MKKLYVVQDVKAEYFMPPQAFRNAAEATRSFKQAIDMPDSQFNAHPEDFRMWEVGTWDEDKGLIKVYDTPTHTVDGTELAQPMNVPEKALIALN